MIASASLDTRLAFPIEQHVAIAKLITSRLKRRYPWLDSDELYSYSLWGLMGASKLYRDQMGTSFCTFVRMKAFYLAVDAMRKDRLLTRKRAGREQTSIEQSSSFADELPDSRGMQDSEEFEQREFLEHILCRLGEDDRVLLLHYYADGMNFKEIGLLCGKSESSISVRHKLLMDRLRRMTRVA